jgi:hypothetical protein
MLTTIKGYYENRQIILEEKPPVEEKTEVVITFLEKKMQTDKKTWRTPGGLKGKVSIPDDFNDPLSDLKDYM